MRPTLRTPGPGTCATPRKSALSARPTARDSRAIGPVPLRTARGDGPIEVEPPFDAGFLLRDWPPDDRLVDPEAFEVAREPDFEVPLPRDAGGEDVRVAMVVNLRDR